MDARWRRLAVIGLVVIAVGAFLVYAVTRRERFLAAKPAWLDPQQPPDGIASQLPTLSDAESWAANRATPMAQCCGDNTARRSIRRTYPGSLAESGHSFIRGTVAVQLGGEC